MFKEGETLEGTIQSDDKESLLRMLSNTGVMENIASQRSASTGEQKHQASRLSMLEENQGASVEWSTRNEVVTNKFAALLRESSEEIDFTYTTYERWRSASSEACRRLTQNNLMPDLTLETTPLKPLKKKVEEMKRKGWGDDRICMHVLCNDVPEAAVGLYEKVTLKHLDSKCATKCHHQAEYRTHPAWKQEHQWAPLYFRKHLVVAYKGNSHIIVYNPATRDFCDTNDNANNEPRRTFYENTWRSLANKAFGSELEVTVRHMDVQGHNDCGVWIYLIPHLLHDRDKATATIVNPDDVYANYISNIVGLRPDMKSHEHEAAIIWRNGRKKDELVCCGRKNGTLGIEKIVPKVHMSVLHLLNLVVREFAGYVYKMWNNMYS